MAVTPFDSALWRGIFGDAELQPLFSDAAEIRAMMLVEGALARAEAKCGLIPAEAAAAITKAANEAMIDAGALSGRAAADGVSALGFVEAFRAALPLEAGSWLHHGATSQDIVDTALVLRLRRALDIIEGRLAALDKSLAEAAKAHEGTVMAARTRGQLATPTTLGAKIAVWRAPLARSRERLPELRPRLLRASLGGASGTLAALGADGLRVARAFADELSLACDTVPWHAARDVVAELGGALTLVSGALGKIGLDLVLLAQNEVGEVRAGAGGASSTMPNKANPVGAEALIALARANAGIVGRLYEAQLHAQERDGAAWALEWLTLPQIVVATGAGLRIACEQIGSLEVRPKAMRRTLDAALGLTGAEAARFALGPHMTRGEAKALVKAACAEAVKEGRPLAEIMARMSDAPVDWERVLAPENWLGVAREIARGDEG